MANFQLQKQQEITPIKLLSECFVKPLYESLAAIPTYHLGPVDLAMLNLDPIQKGLLYTLNHDANIVPHLLEKLKHSLSIALVFFYPLAGRFTTQKYVEENMCSIYVDCNKGPGARFIHATALHLTVSDILSSSDATIVRSFFDLGEKSVNYDGHTKALLSIQITELLDGVFIGFSMSHSVGDGTSFIHFVNMLSEIYISIDNNNASENNTTHISREPIFNYRPWLTYDPSNEDVPVLKLPFINVEESICRTYDPSPIRERIFHFPSASMAKLKVEANDECGTHNDISSFQALTALVWRSITRVRNLALDQQTTCFLPIGARNRLNPPISDDYFGNFIISAQCTCMEELLCHGLGSVAMKLKKHIMSQDGKVVLDRLQKLANSPIVVSRGLAPNSLGMNGVIIAGSPRFDMYRSEFGFGRALAVRMGYGNKEDGKITISQGCEGGGSIDLDMCLRPHIMVALEADQEFMSFVSTS